MEYVETLQGVWKKVREQYSLGSCVSERGLQALLYAEIRQEFPEKKIIVEPRWSDSSGVYVPDIAIVNGDVVTDVFEIKFKPGSFPKHQDDIRKLIRYGTELQECAVSIDPLSGKSERVLRTSVDLRRHFVVVANNDAAAVWSGDFARDVPELTQHLSSFYHWFGRIGAGDFPSQQWDVHVGELERTDIGTGDHT